MPLVQNGSFNLKDRGEACRRGSRGRSTVFPLWTPPGMGIQSAQPSIPSRRTRPKCVLPMQRGSERRSPRKWKTAFIAFAGVTGSPPPKPNDPTTAPSSGPVWTSSTQLFSLESRGPGLVTIDDGTPRRGARPDDATVLQGGGGDTPFDGKAKVTTLIGLPAKVTTQVRGTDEGHEGTRLRRSSTDKTSPAGKHGGIFVTGAVIDKGGELMCGQRRWKRSFVLMCRCLRRRRRNATNADPPCRDADGDDPPPKTDRSADEASNEVGATAARTRGTRESRRAGGTPLPAEKKDEKKK